MFNVKYYKKLTRLKNSCIAGKVYSQIFQVRVVHKNYILNIINIKLIITRTIIIPIVLVEIIQLFFIVKKNINFNFFRSIV